MVDNIRQSYELFGFSPIETPTLEYSDILTGKYGDEGDKLMYRFKDNGDRDVALRYDLTIPLARVVAQYGDIKKPFKRYQIANVFRADNPQKGRYREFCQCDADIVGSENIQADAEILALVGTVLENLGVRDYEIQVNDRKILSALYKSCGFDIDEQKIVIRAMDKIEKIGQKGVKKELEKDLPQEKVNNLFSSIGRYVANINVENPEGLKSIRKSFLDLNLPSRILDVIESAFKINPKIRFTIAFSIARGLDYYTGTIFETRLTKAMQFGSVLSGGRYDNLVGTFANKNVPAVGMSVGVDRLFAALQELKLVPEIKTVTKVLAPDAQTAATLRAAGINTEYLFEAPDFKKMMKYAEDRNIPFAIIIDESEAKENKVKLVNMQTRDKKVMTLEEAIKEIK